MAAITLSNTMVLANAPVGTVIGTFNVAVLMRSNPSSYFKVQGLNLVTAWTTPPIPATYLVLVSSGAGLASFQIKIVAVPVVPIVTLTPSAITVADNSAVNGNLSNVSVSMSDGSAFSGSLTASPSSLAKITGSKVVLSRNLTASDDGSPIITVTASQAGSTGSATLAVKVVAVAPPPPPQISPDGTTSTPPNGPALITTAGTWTWSSAAPGRPGEYNIYLNGAPAPGIGNLMEVADKGQLYVNTTSSGWYVWNNWFVRSAGPGGSPPPVPTSVTLTPASLSLPDNSPAGTTASTVAVAMSDGSAFSGTLAVAGAGMVVLSGSTVVLARALIPADDGAHSFAITATQGGTTASASLALSVTATGAAVPDITVTPVTPQIPDTTPKGSAVATYTVTMSDGSPFVGTVGFGAPNFDAGGIFALSGSPTSGNVIVSPTGPGVGPNMGTVTDHITLQATQP